MKQYLLLGVFLLTVQALQAQDQITLKSGEVLNGKVAEVGINEIKYYKASNLQGPVYVIGKADVAQILYQNKTVDVFNNAPASATQSNQPVVVVTQPVQERVIVQQQPVYRRRYWPVVIDAHIPIFSHHDGGHYFESHHGGGHH